jgi:hypothetical protein
MWSRGFGADESKAAFIRARELAAAIDNATERFTIYYGLWVGNLSRGEFGFAQEIAETFLREAERGARTTDCGFGRRLPGSTAARAGTAKARFHCPPQDPSEPAHPGACPAPGDRLA